MDQTLCSLMLMNQTFAVAVDVVDVAVCFHLFVFFCFRLFFWLLEGRLCLLLFVVVFVFAFFFSFAMVCVSFFFL